MDQLIRAMRAAHITLHNDEREHVLRAAADLLALANTLPPAPAQAAEPATTSVNDLRPDTEAPHALQPEQFAPAVHNGFIRVPRVID